MAYPRRSCVSNGRTAQVGENIDPENFKLL